MNTCQKNALWHSKLLIDNLIKFMHEGLLVLNDRNCIELANEAALDLFGYSDHGDLLGKHASAMYAYEDEFDNFLTLHEQGENTDNWENTFRRTDGSTFVSSYSIRQVQDEETSKQIKLILLQDISAQKQSERVIADYTRNLERSNKALDQFAYIVSHDLKAPLRAIHNLSSWLQEDLGPSLSDENRNNLMMLRGRVMRMESLINGILEYSKIGRERLPKETIDVFKLLHEVVELLVPPAHIQVQVDPWMPVLETPKIMLFQVFSNLIGNAIKYNDKPEGLVRVYAKEKDASFEFVIEDNGPGIAREYHEKIFVIFQTLQARDKFESTGIGLAIVKRIIATIGGEIRVESGVGNGSKFIFNWPK